MNHQIDFVAATTLLLLLCAACNAPQTSSVAADDYRPTATIKDIMDSVIDPSADEIWESAGVVVDIEGEHDLFPQTDEEWVAVRRSAIRVIEGSNLLLMPGRIVAEPGANSEFPDIELEPEQIQELLEQDPEMWVELAHGLHDMGRATLAAIDSRDTDGLLAAGDALDVACERCHLNYWYPNDENARAAFEERERLGLEEITIPGDER